VLFNILCGRVFVNNFKQFINGYGWVICLGISVYFGYRCVTSSGIGYLDDAPNPTYILKYGLFSISAAFWALILKIK
jgi:hypothetical protein